MPKITLNYDQAHSFVKKTNHLDFFGMAGQ